MLIRNADFREYFLDTLYLVGFILSNLASTQVITVESYFGVGEEPEEESESGEFAEIEDTENPENNEKDKAEKSESEEEEGKPQNN